MNGVKGMKRGNTRQIRSEAAIGWRSMESDRIVSPRHEPAQAHGISDAPDVVEIKQRCRKKAQAHGISDAPAPTVEEEMEKVALWLRDFGHNGYDTGRLRQDHLNLIAAETGVDMEIVAKTYDYMRQKNILKIICLPTGITQFFARI